MKKPSASNTVSAWTELMEEMLIDFLKVGHDAAKEAVKNHLFDFVGTSSITSSRR